MTEGTHRQQIHRDNAQGRERRDTPMGQPGHTDHQNHDPQQQHKQPSMRMANVSAIEKAGKSLWPAHR
jgi:hypothetical protein